MALQLIGTDALADEAVSTDKSQPFGNIILDSSAAGTDVGDRILLDRTNANGQDAGDAINVEKEILDIEGINVASRKQLKLGAVILESGTTDTVDGDVLLLDSTASGVDEGEMVLYNETFIDKVGLFNINTLGSAGQVLTSAGTGAVPSFQDASGADFVGFKAFASGNQSISGTTDTLLAFGGEVFDVGNNFASNTFTCPADGKYFFYANAYIAGMGSTTAQLNFNHAVAGGSTFSGSVIRNGPMDTSSRDGAIGTLGAIFDMTQNSTVTVRIFIFAGKTVEGNSTGETSKTTFGGYKIG